LLPPALAFACVDVEPDPALDDEPHPAATSATSASAPQIRAVRTNLILRHLRIAD
jgi:hypothetical protein